MFPPSSTTRPSSRILARIDGISSASAWTLGVATGCVAVGMLVGSVEIWAALLLPLLAVGVVRRAGIRPEYRRRPRGSFSTTVIASVAVAGAVVMAGQSLGALTLGDASSSTSDNDDLLTDLHLDLGIEPNLPDARERDEMVMAVDGPIDSSGTDDGAGTDDTDANTDTDDTTTGTTGPDELVGDERGQVSPSPADDGGLSDTNRPGQEPQPDNVAAPPQCDEGMILIEGGTFVSHGETHSIETFCIDKTEVSVIRYRQCLYEGKKLRRGCDSGGVRTTQDVGKRGVRNPKCSMNDDDGGQLPINCVSWSEASRFCAWANKRLPTQWEWEWAARGRDEGNRYPWGDRSPSCKLTVMHDHGHGCGQGGPAPVGTKGKDSTPEGVRDMGGNVQEWTSSLFGGGSERIVRGGGLHADKRSVFQVETQTPENPLESQLHLGFRCVGSVIDDNDDTRDGPVQRERGRYKVADPYR